MQNTIQTTVPAQASKNAPVELSFDQLALVTGGFGPHDNWAAAVSVDTVQGPHDNWASVAGPHDNW